MSHKCEESFQLLKKFLNSSPALKIVDLENDFLVCTNTCIEGLGGLLMQYGYLICYESINLEHENNCAIHDLDNVSIVHSLKMWSHYLI